MTQLSMLDPQDDPNQDVVVVDKVVIPREIDDQLSRGAMLLVSVSAGKDSMAQAYALAKLRKDRGWTGRLVAIHADVGRMEWSYSTETCERIAREIGAEFVVVKHKQRDLLEGIHARQAKRPDAPPFPSSAARWCTSDYKRNPIDSWIRNNVAPGERCVSTCGFRREESASRARQPYYEIRKQASSPQKNRIVWNWNPILEFTLEDVWTTIGHSLDELEQIKARVAEFRQSGKRSLTEIKDLCDTLGFRGHVSYALGNQRCSCTMCVLGSENDALNGAEFHPEVFNELVAIEKSSGFSFQQNKPIIRLAELLAAQQSENEQKLAA